MAISLDIKVEGKALKTLQMLAKRMDNLQPVMREIGEVVRESVMRNFREQRSPEGAPWKPSLRALVQGGLTLVDTATLRNSINVRARRRSVTIGTPVEYAAVHQFGARKGSFGNVTVHVREHIRRLASGKEVKVRAHTRNMRVPWGNIPARPFLGVRRSDWVEIQDIIVEHLFNT